jgi:hypothetical protein
MGELKYNTERSLRYIELHHKIVDEGFRFSDYYYAPDGDRCECGKENINHCFVLTNGKDNIVLGSVCIIRNQNYIAIFDGNAQKWKQLQDELKQYAELFKLIKDSPEYNNRRIPLEQLEEMKKKLVADYNETFNERMIRTKAILNTLKVYEWKTRHYFLSSLINQIEMGHTLSDKQVEVSSKIIDQYNKDNNTTIEQMMKEYDEGLLLPTYADDFKTLTMNLNLGMYDRDSVNRLMELRNFNDWDIMRADKILIKYRRQLKERYNILLDLVTDNDTERMVYIRAYDRVVEVITEMKN